ncbi:MAG: tRNA pseudouridine(13) synthase TruD [Candidatus Micrarchaeia archaeon]
MEFSRFSKLKRPIGKIKQSPEDFIVEEISRNGEIFEIGKNFKRNDKQGDFTYFILEKKNYTTSNAIKQISRRLYTGSKRFNYAGTKDRLAHTTQLCSAYKIPKEKILGLNMQDIKINSAWIEKEKLKLGDLIGNKFGIRINFEDGKSHEKQIKKIYSNLGGKFPNYFGEQRFGSTRKNTKKIGEFLLKNRIKDAVIAYLCDFEGETNPDAVSARKELKETMDFRKALENFPKYLTHERTLLASLCQNPNDFANALRRLPRPVLLLFVHAFQSYLFNLNLSERIKDKRIKKEKGEYFCGTNFYKFPEIKKGGKDWLCVKLIGYESKINERESELLESFGITTNDFRIKSIPELSSKGIYRTFFSPIRDFSFKDDIFSFSLPSGSYATSLLREFLDYS